MASMRCIWCPVNCTFNTALMDQLNRCVLNVLLNVMFRGFKQSLQHHTHSLHASGLTFKNVFFLEMYLDDG